MQPAGDRWSLILQLTSNLASAIIKTSLFDVSLCSCRTPSAQIQKSHFVLQGSEMRFCVCVCACAWASWLHRVNMEVFAGWIVYFSAMQSELNDNERGRVWDQLFACFRSSMSADVVVGFSLCLSQNQVTLLFSFPLPNLISVQLLLLTWPVLYLFGSLVILLCDKTHCCTIKVCSRHVNTLGWRSLANCTPSVVTPLRQLHKHNVWLCD